MEASPWAKQRSWCWRRMYRASACAYHGRKISTGVSHDAESSTYSWPMRLVYSGWPARREPMDAPTPVRLSLLNDLDERAGDAQASSE